MKQDQPIDFEGQVKSSKAKDAPPYIIRASDLMKNFAFSAVQAEDSWLETASMNGHDGRKLKLPAVNGSGTYVLGSVNGQIQWIETEEC